MVFASVQPAIRPMFKRHLKCCQDPIQILHHIKVREPQNCIAKVTFYPPVTRCIALGIVGVTIDFHNQALCRAEEINNPAADYSLPPELVSQESADA